MAHAPHHQALAEVFRALGSPARLRILESLAEQGGSPVDYTRRYPESESLGRASHHFRALRQAGLIEVSSIEQRRGALKNNYELTASGKRWLQAVQQFPT